MPSCARAITSFSPEERRKLFNTARNVIYHSGLDVRIAHTTNPLARILIVTPKRCGNAPQRNRIRRRLKALFYEEKLYQRSYDILVLCKKSGIDLTYQELRAFLTSVLERAAHD